ncbi:MAG: flagellar export protein FliJ [Armatimonadia bacterium]|nr:flagellar export protein FliJ [Armatimonadia bacterium]
MRKYQFPLQTALDLRCREEERAQRHLARAQRTVSDRRSDLERTRRRHDALVASLRGTSGHNGATVALGEIEHASRVLADLRRRLLNQSRRLQEAEQECRRRREELVEASRARSTLERLSERREAEHHRAEILQEQRELNEAAISRHRASPSTGLTTSLTRDLNNVA